MMSKRTFSLIRYYTLLIGSLMTALYLALTPSELNIAISLTLGMIFYVLTIYGQLKGYIPLPKNEGDKS